MNRFFLFFPALLVASSPILFAQSMADPGQGSFAKSPALDAPPERGEAQIETKIIRQVGVNVGSADAQRSWRPAFANLDKWLSFVEQPGYRLLYKQQSKEYYGAVFLTGKHSLVVATHKIQATSEDAGHGFVFEIDAADGSDAGDRKHRVPLEIECILHAANAADGDYFVNAGWLVPVRGRSEGTLHVFMTERVFTGYASPEKSKDNGKREWKVLDCKIDWPPR